MSSKYLKSSGGCLVSDRIAAAQAGCALVAGAVAWPALGGVAGFSAVLAGVISALSTWYMGRKVFNNRARTAAQRLQNIYLAQLLKMALVIALCCLAFALAPVHFPVFIATYAMTLTLYGAALATLKTGLETNRRDAVQSARP